VHSLLALFFLTFSLSVFSEDPCPAPALVRGTESGIEQIALKTHELKAQEYLSQNKLQEAIWELDLAQNYSQTEDLKKLLQQKLTGKPVKMKFHGDGSSISIKLYFADGTKALFRFTDAQIKEEADIRGDLAAYAVDQKLHLNAVPMTVSTTIDVPKDIIPKEQLARFKGGKVKGVAMYWVDDVEEANSINNKKFPQDLKFFDQLILNTDRGLHNYLVQKDSGHFVAIDHDRAFRNADEYKKQGVKSDQKQIPSAPILAKLREVSTEEWTEVLKDKLNPDRLKEFLGRREAFLNPDKPVDALIFSN